MSDDPYAAKPWLKHYDENVPANIDYPEINLYEILDNTAKDFAGLTGNEIVYDLYTGTGTIAAFVSRYAKKVVGIEYVAPAIKDAKENSALNSGVYTTQGKIINQVYKRALEGRKEL